MADSTSLKLWERLKAGTSPAQQETGPKTTDATTLALLRQARGETDYSFVHEANAKGQADFQAAVRKRARELVAQNGLSWSFAEARALQELREEQRATAERDSRRSVYDAMVSSNRAETEANSTENLRGRIRETSAPRSQEKADADLVAALRAITGARRSA